MRKVLSFLSLALFSFSLEIIAQQARPEEIKFKTDTALIGKVKDEFILPEFVITGRETIEVKAGRKLESSEVNLPEVNLKLYEIPAEGKIFTEINLSGDKVVYSKLAEKSPTAKFKAGFGRYTTTYFDGMIQGGLFKGLLINSNFYHRSSQGFVEGADFVKNQFSVGFNFELPRMKDKIFYWLENARLSSMFSYLTHSFGFYALNPAPRRSINFVDFGLTLESAYRKSFDYGLKVNYLDFTVIDTFSTYESLKFNGREKRLDLDFKFRSNIDLLRLKFNVFYTLLVERYFKFEVNAEGLSEFFELKGDYDLGFGIKLFSFEDYSGKGNFKIYPNASFKYPVGRGTQVYALFSPEILNLTISDHLMVNRFLTKNLNLVRPENYFNLAFGVGHSFGKGSFDVKLSFKAFKNFPIYVEHSSGLYSAEFERAQFVELKGSGYLNYRQNDLIFDLTLRSSYNARSRKPVPYYPNFAAIIGHRYKLRFGLAINSEISLISSRAFDFENNELNGFVLANFGLEYRILKNFVAFVNFTNFFSQKFYLWNGYLEPYLVFLAGIEYKF